jgi:hypothetical protein
MTDSNLDTNEIKQSEANRKDTEGSRVQTRRSALGLSFAGGLAAMLAACGKYVTKFDKTRLGAKIQGEGDGEGEVVGSTATPTPTPTPTVTPKPPGPPEPTEKLCFDVSKATKVAEADFFVAGAKSLYGNKFSSLLAVKALEGKEWSPAAGDLIHVLVKADDKHSYLAASRSVRNTDKYADGVGLVFESLYLDTYVALQLVVTKGDKQYIVEVPISYDTKHKDKPVYDLSSARVDKAKTEELFSLGFGFDVGGSKVPHMGGTSNIGNEKALGAMLHGDGNYLAAQANSTWNLSSLIPEGTDVKNIFGQLIDVSDAAVKNKLLHENQSLLVYRPRKDTIGGKAIDGYLRYFIYVG